MLCAECSAEVGELRNSSQHLHLFPFVTLNIGEGRYRNLLLSCVSRIPLNGTAIRFPTVISLRKRGSLPGVVGLTKFLVKGYSSNGARVDNQAQHSITFYTNLLDRLSDQAVVAVIAHEVAHAWLNEHVAPEASKAREEDADLLAEIWGFDKELEALSSETDPIDPN